MCLTQLHLLRDLALNHLSHRKYFLAALGHAGLNNLLAAYPDKTAYAVCTFGYCGGPGQAPLLFQGRTEGKIVDARGPPTFGWDAVFEYEGQTYAEMDKARKVSCCFLSCDLNLFVWKG